ncbi:MULTISPECIES: hypothetical protein [Micromonospora]|nr:MULTISPECIES: hypothetical protein [unclassified Micromonospora]MBM0225070.1 hypothetical protein [Micromonospora sp. ATA51]MDZ5447089.1 hypothetical protein [Micromonospora sp. 4G57]MDZ5494551.1 hypothetical protein [Micromonospora sp. 4G53]
MIGKVLAATVRHRHTVLMLGLLVAGGNAVAVGFAPSLGQLLFFPLLFLAVALLVLAILSWQTRPAYFVVQPQIPAFGTPVPAWKVFLPLCSLAPFSAEVGALMRSARQGTPWTPESILLPVSWLLLVALLVVEAWRGYGPQLRPHGVQQRTVLGSLIVPWEALPVAQTPLPVGPPSTLWLAYAQPQLVRRRGIPWSRHALRTDNVDAWFLAAAIRHYVCHPDRRAAVGSHEEYQRLLAELPGRER